ncbi:hypothetical protein PENTCL1PPCAC_28656, partial [Pristionchus entomophagus]
AMRDALVLAALSLVAVAQTGGWWDQPTPDYGDVSVGPSDATAGYCACNPGQIYLDVVFIVDTSADMTSKTVGDATATIQSTLIPLTFGTSLYQSQVGILAFADTVEIVKNFGDLRNINDVFGFQLPYLGGKATKMTDAIKQASSIISNNEREFTRGVIVLLSKSFNQLDATNVKEAVESFKDDGGIFITIDYAKGGIKGLEELATTGYYNNDPSTNPDALNMDTIYALCDANCFCPDGLYPYNTPNAQTGREVPLGCYHVADVPSVYDAAANNCKNQKGFVATVHDDDKNFFLVSVFPPKARYWLGLKRNGGGYEWADQSNDGFTYWAPGNPIAGQDCVYGQQQTGFNSAWFSAPCTDPLKYSMTYACQLRPCDTEYDCRV